MKTALRRSILFVFTIFFSFLYDTSYAADENVVWIENGLAFTNGPNSITPSKSLNIKQVPGLNRKAVYIPENGVLEYPANRLINPEQGSISFWLKLDKAPSGILHYRDRDRLENGEWGNQLGGSPFNRSLFESGGFSSMLNSGISFTAMNTSTRAVMLPKRVFEEEWHHLAYTWEKNGKICLYIDGILQRPEKAKNNTSHISRFLRIGSSKRYKGLEGTIDEFSIYQTVLAPKDIQKQYTKYHPLRYELLDYALTAGRMNKVRFRVRNISGNDYKNSIEIAGQKIVLDLKPDELKELTVEITPEHAGLFRIVCNRKSNMRRSFEAYALMPPSKTEKVHYGVPELKLIQEINCAAPIQKGKYTDAGTCRVINGYRESTVVESGIGFSYRMEIANPGKPYWLEVDYPDNADRSFIVFVYPYKYNRIYTSSLDNIGIITGNGYPVTGKMHTKRLLFWPDSKEIAVAVVSYKNMKNNSGPAVAKLRLYENVGPLSVAKVPQGGRGLSRWQEDPLMTARLWFNHANNYKDANLEYWKIKWSRVIDYMLYNGFNSWIIQSMDYFGDVSSMNATLSAPSYLTAKGGRVPGWDELGAAMLEQKNLGFYIRLNPIIFTRSKWFLQLTELSDTTPIEIVKKDGSRLTGFRDNVNILHPAVLKAYKKIIRAYRDKFSRFKNFKGICFNEHIDFSLQNLDQGYDDYSIALFEKENKIRIPVSSPAKRYDWLMKNAKKTWIDWRCKKVTEFAAELGQTVRDKSNSTLELQLWISADRFLYNLENWPRFKAEQSLRNAGINVAELSKQSGIVVVPAVRPDYERIHQVHSNEEYLGYSPELTDIFKDGQLDSINIFRHSNMEIYWNLNSKTHKFKPFWHPAGTNLADNVCIGFSTPLPNREFALDMMTHCLAKYDLQNIIHGWWGNVENGEHEAFRKFYTAFRNIPAGHYELAPGTNDPVAIRVGTKGFYMVNRESYPVSVTYKLNGKITERKLLGNEVYSEKLSVQPVITDVIQNVPDSQIEYLKSQINKLKSVRKMYAETHHSAPALDYVIKQAEKAIAEKRVARVRHLMYTQAAGKALNEMSIRLKAEYDWLHKTLKIKIDNIAPATFAGSLSLKSIPKGWTADKTDIRIEDLKSGESKNYEFLFRGGKLHDWDIFRISLRGNGLSREYQYRFPCCFASEEGFEQPNKSGAFVHSDGHLLNKNAPKLKKRIGKRIVGKYALQWNSKGSGLRVLAEIDDPQFISPVKEGHMYLGDSIQIYFDQKNNAEAGAVGYDGDDVTFQVGMLNGKAEVWCDTPVRGKVDIPAKIVHKNGKTSYDVFIPDTLLPQANLKPGNVIGFGILFNQLMKDENGEFMLKLSRLGETYRQPGNWQYFYLSGQRENSNAVIGLRFHSGIPGNIKIVNAKLKKQDSGKNLSIESPNLTDQETVVSTTFVPDENGILTINLGTGYMDRVKYLSVTVDGSELLSGDFSEYNPSLPDTWKVSGRKPRVGNDGVDVPYGSNLSRNIEATKGKTINISVKVTLPNE